jgi:two-component system chemotaxis sensor kinase CheA
MATDQSILDMFFEECEDLIVALTEGLTEMRDGQTDQETVNAVFRSVHSIKGAAGAFSLDELVGFAHKFETVLDEVRSDRLTPTEDLLHVLQRAGDVLADLVEAARDNIPGNRTQIDPILTELQGFLGDDEPEPEEEFVFEAMTLDIAVPNTQAGYRITFKPNHEFYTCGHDPVLIIGALRDLGATTTNVDASALPIDFAEFEWDAGYLVWTVEIADLASEDAIQEIFQFVDDLCELSVVPLGDLAAPENQNEEQPFAPPEPITPVVEDSQPKTENVVSPTSPTAEKKPAKRAAASLRVDPERVDRLINAVGELIINQSVISQRLEKADLPNSSDIFTDLDDYKLLAREIQEGVMAIRAQPVKPLFQRMLRIAREAADDTGKDVDLVTTGETTEVDKTVVERLADPLTHMIRNAIDHGIETPAQRAAAGKPKQGTLRLSASQRAGSIVIEIADDGAGLNRARIKEIAIEKGLIPSDALLTNQEVDLLLFAPGFSTASEVTNLSGRGVGMDVVKTAITTLGGRVTIASTPGEGTIFSITLPLTLAVLEGMIISVCGQTMVVPISSILESIRPRAADLSQIGLRGELLRIRGEYVPIIDLAEQLGHPSHGRKMTERVLLLIQTESVPQCALAVDDIYDQRQVVVKSMQGNYGAISGISGATILGDGKIALIIDPDAIALNAAPASTPSLIDEEEQRYVAAN